MNVLARNHVVVDGWPAGRHMVFAHGFGCDQNMWRLVAPAFEDRYPSSCSTTSVLAGPTWRPTTPTGMRRSTDTPATCWTICAALDLRDVIFVGHSVSAMVGVLAAIAAPERFGALVLVGPSPRYIDDEGLHRRIQPRRYRRAAGIAGEQLSGVVAAMAPVIMGNGDRPELGPS